MTRRVELSVGVIIPTLNEADRIGPLIVGLGAAGFREIIVADGGSADATVGNAKAASAAVIVSAPRGRGTQINAAAKVARADVLVLLHADTVLPPDALSVVRAVMADTAVAGGCFRLSFDDSAASMRFYAWTTRFETGLTTFGDQAFFVRRSAFEAFGGAPEWPFMEDVELRLRLRRAGRFVKLPQSVTTSARRFAVRGRWLGQLRNIAILTAFKLGASPFWLASFYDVQRAKSATGAATRERHPELK